MNRQGKVFQANADGSISDVERSRDQLLEDYTDTLDYVMQTAGHLVRDLLATYGGSLSDEIELKNYCSERLNDSILEPRM